MKLADARDVATGILATIRGANAHSFEMVSKPLDAELVQGLGFPQGTEHCLGRLDPLQLLDDL